MSEPIQATKPLHFLEEIIEADLRENTHNGRVLTRFPPEPNGYLHLGHAKSICLNFSLAQRYGGATNLRFDDTNPVTEETEYVDSIKEDVQWLGFQWAEERYASDYFQELYAFAIELIKKGLAYVDDSSAEQIAQQKGTPTQAGTPNTFRERSVEENLALFVQMKNGDFPDGAKVLRAKIDLASPNMHFRDPIIYRIKHATHHRTGDAWCIYPMYDFAHGQSDAIEKITHSICTLEFIPHRPLYDWFIEQLGLYPSKQHEFSRLNLTYTVMSKRKLLQLVTENHVSGWDDPRMPTLSGLRRRGYPAAAVREFCEKIGISRRENLIDVGLLEACVREELNHTAARMMVVLDEDPIKITITNYPENQSETLHIENNPEQPETGSRGVVFSRELWIERDDFMENPPKRFFRLSPGNMVRLKGAYIIRCEEVVKDTDGKVNELLVSYLPESKSGQDTTGLKVNGTIHWVNAADALPIEVCLYDRLFQVENPLDETEDFKNYLNPTSLVRTQALAEPALAMLATGQAVQFLRKGYFCKDASEGLVFNRTVTLKDGWKKP